jgi:hypothetical protein
MIIPLPDEIEERLTADDQPYGKSLGGKPVG